LGPNQNRWLLGACWILALLASLSAVALDPILNRASGDSREAVEAAKAADAH
jgi:hypothetical protein